MTKKDALIATSKRFTNLLDGKVISNAGVFEIIGYYESLIQDVKLVVKSTSNIETKFQEAEIEDMLNEEDYWDDQFYLIQ